MRCIRVVDMGRAAIGGVAVRPSGLRAFTRRVYKVEGYDCILNVYVCLLYLIVFVSMHKLYTHYNFVFSH